MPPGVAQPDSALVNWIAVATGDGAHFGVALSNSSKRDITTSVTLDRNRLGVGEDDTPGLTFLDADGHATSPGTLGEDRIEVAITASGLAAFILDGVRIDEPLHRFGHATEPGGAAFVTLAEDDSHLGTVRAACVAMGPGHSFAFVFTTLKPDQAARVVLSYEQGGETREAICVRFPFEVSVPMSDSPFTFRFVVIDHDGRRYETEPAHLNAPQPVNITTGASE
jgi:hypothetical protein